MAARHLKQDMCGLMVRAIDITIAFLVSYVKTKMHYGDQLLGRRCHLF